MVPVAIWPEMWKVIFGTLELIAPVPTGISREWAPSPEKFRQVCLTYPKFQLAVITGSGHHLASDLWPFYYARSAKQYRLENRTRTTWSE